MTSADHVSLPDMTYLGTVRRLHLGFSGNVFDIGRRGRQSLLLRVRKGATLADLKERR
jgi:hypothetical protein